MEINFLYLYPYDPCNSGGTYSGKFSVGQTIMMYAAKLRSIFLACTVLTGILGFSGIVPVITKVAQNLCVIFLTLFLFSAVAYSVRGGDSPD